MRFIYGIGVRRRNAVGVESAWFDLIAGMTGVAGRDSGTWADHAAASMLRVFAGLAWSVPLGISVGLSRLVEKVVDPRLRMLRNVPVNARVPLSLSLSPAY